jgi:hypothetical protein
MYFPPADFEYQCVQFFLDIVYIRIMSEWNTLVKQIFDKNRLKNKAYRLGDAMRDAKKVYKKTTATAKKIMNMQFDRKHKGRRTRGRRHRGRRHRGGEGDAVVESKSVDGGEPASEKKGLFSGLF